MPSFFRCGVGAPEACCFLLRSAGAACSSTRLKGACGLSAKASRAAMSAGWGSCLLVVAAENTVLGKRSSVKHPRSRWCKVCSVKGFSLALRARWQGVGYGGLCRGLANTTSQTNPGSTQPNQTFSTPFGNSSPPRALPASPKVSGFSSMRPWPRSAPPCFRPSPTSVAKAGSAQPTASNSGFSTPASAPSNFASAITQRTPPENHFPSFKVHHVRR